MRVDLFHSHLDTTFVCAHIRRTGIPLRFCMCLNDYGLRALPIHGTFKYVLYETAVHVREIIKYGCVCVCFLVQLLIGLFKTKRNTCLSVHTYKCCVKTLLRHKTHPH